MMKSERERNKDLNPIHWMGWFLFLAGLAVRLFQLGLNGFWFDEIGVARVLYAENLLQVLRISKSHVMAMPLDYFIAFGLSRFTHSEFFLRLPSVLWGSFSVLILYQLVIKISGEKWAAALTAFLLVISPIHIQYSQELRFYSPLVFFFLLSFYFLLNALEQPKNKNWLLYAMVLLIGCFFHLYVALVALAGLFWCLISYLYKKNITQELLYFLMTHTMIFLIVISAALILTSNQHTGTTYDHLASTIQQTVLMGMGLLPPRIIQSGFSETVLLALTIGFFGFGLIKLVLSGRRWNQVIAAFLVIAPILLVGLVVVKHYFILPRQLILLVPFTVYAIATGFLDVMASLTAQVKSWKIQKSISLAFLLLLLWLPIEGMFIYYKTPTKLAREITRVLIEQADPSATVYVYPYWEVDSYLYYYDQLVGGKYPGKLLGLQSNTISDYDLNPGSYLVLDANQDPLLLKSLASIGAQPLMIHHPLQDRSNYLWVLPE